MTESSSGPPSEPSPNARMLGGVAAAAVALGVAMLVGIPFGAPADPRNAVGSAVVDLTPGPVKEWVIQTLGSLDKLFLAVVVLAVIATVAALAATYETRHRPIGSAIFVDAGLIYTTDGRVKGFDLKVLEDDKGFFPSYAVTPVVRKDTLEANPGLEEALNTLSAQLNNDVITELNKKVDIDHQSPQQVARDFLRSKQLL